MLITKDKTILSPYIVLGILTVITLLISLQSLLLEPNAFGDTEVKYTHYNNYIIFKQSFYHLIHGQDLYVWYPKEQYDLYKYSPAFSLLMAPLAILPDAIGLFLWNFLNVIVLFYAIWKLPLFSNKKRLLLLGFVLIELITSIQNSQSNALIAGLVLLAFVMMEQKRVALATLFIVLTVFIKLFGIVALALFIFYPQKVKSALYTLFWILLFTFLPLLVVSPTQLNFLYHSWANMLGNDHSASIGLSVSGWLYSWFGLELKNSVVLVGALLFCIPLLKFGYYHELRFKLLVLASILLWIVIFNHKAESPTFIIAMCGAALWFFSQKFKTENLILLLLAFVFTQLSPTDLFPKSLKEQYIEPYVLKAVPSILIWLKLTYDLIFYKSEIPTADPNNSYTAHEVPL